MVKNNLVRLSANLVCAFISRVFAILSKETLVLHSISSGALLITFVGTLYKALTAFPVDQSELHFWFSYYYKWIVIARLGI